MIRKLISFFCFLLALNALPAQTPGNISVQGKPGVTLRAPDACNEAGTIRYGAHFGQSNDFSTQVIYLCAGDSMRIIHNQDFDLSGDPNAATAPGIGYAFYNCRPTIDFSGPDLATIQADPCLNKTSPIIINGNPVPQTNGIWLATDRINGNITLFNGGLLQTAYNGGNPIQFWFAPITIDNFATRTYESTGGGPAGACVDVNHEAAFSVVYLNPVTITDLNVNAGPNGCVGSFVVNGGLPQFDPTTDYRVTIVKEDDPTVRAQLNALPDAGDTVRFFVPEPGNYLITVEDGKSCEAIATVDMSGCEAVVFELPFRNARPGDNVCLDVTVENFRDVALFQGTLTWDPAVLRFTGVQGLNPALANSQETFENPAPDTLTFLWFNPINGVTLNDDETIFQVCFDIVGVLGQSSPVRFIDQPTPVEVGDSQDEELGHVTRDGQVNVSNDILFVDIQADSVSCPGLSDGSITVRVAQGTPNYRVTWDSIPSPGPFKGPISIANSGGTAVIPNLPGGEYVIRVEDSGGNTFADTVRVEEALSLGAGILEDPPVCFGESTGSVRVRVTVGGITLTNLTGYSFRWNVTSANVPTLDSVSSGSYAVTVTDPRGCTATASTTLSQPAPITLDPTFTNPSCSGATNGGLVVRASGGNTANGQYSYQWDSLGTFVTDVSTVTGLSEGEYSLTVVDDNGCSQTEIFQLESDKTLTINEVITGITCNGAADGEILLTGATAGAPADLPYTFTWQGPGLPAGDSDQGNTSERTTLAAGTYSVTMSDADPAGCQVVETFTLTDPEPIAITLVNKTDETCVVGNDGAAQATATGGARPYVFRWVDENRDTVAADSIAGNLSAGRYAVLLTDANGCLDSLEVIINAPTPPQIQPIANDTLACFNDTNGTLSVTATPGNAPITGYRWSNNVNGQTISNLSPGTYFVTVTAEDGCISVDSALVVAPEPLRIDSIVAAAPTCATYDDGSLTVFAAGGTMPFTYIWQKSPRNDTLRFNLYPGLAAGAYTVTVVDGNNCGAVTGTGTVTDPPAIAVTFIDTVAVSCFEGTCDGQATANAAYSDGAQGLFSFRWASGETDQDASSSTAVQLCAGAQTVTVTDAQQCFVVDTINVPSPPEITIQADIEPVTCNGRADGRVVLTVSGGTPGYDILWTETGATTTTIEDLAAGIYNAVITDSRGCDKSQRVEIEEPAALQLTLDAAQTEDPSCNGTTDGVIAVTYNAADAVNPLGPDPYTWSGGAAPANSPVANGLAAGTYSVTITDIKGCQDSLSHTLTEPSPIIAVIPDPVDPRCFGESTILLIDTVYGGNGSDIFDYTYQVNNNGLSFTPDQPATIFAGQHIITIEDPKGCTFVDTVDVDQPAELTVTFDPTVVVIELGDSTVRLNPIITSSLPVETFTWTPGAGLSSVNVQRPIVDSLFNNQEFKLTVVDVNGCQGMGSVLVRIDKNRNVYIPNVFSPNGDGPNDEFRIFACKGVRNITFARIFDRWGGLVYESPELFSNCEGGTVVWDGRRGSQDMPTGVYVYMIQVEFIDGIELLYRGDVTLLR